LRRVGRVRTLLYVWLRAVFADSIYNRLAALLACYLGGLVLIIVRRPAGTTGFVVQPRRWVVERSLGWFGRWRRLSKDYEALPEVAETMVTLAAIRLMLHRLAHPNRRRLPPPITFKTGCQQRVSPSEHGLLAPSAAGRSAMARSRDARRNMQSDADAPKAAVA
jgi:hypothetical protein